MYDKYFTEWEVLPEFQPEYVSLWSDWLGKEQLHLIDEVTEQEWERFNLLIDLISKHYKIGFANCANETISFPSKIKSTFSSYSDSMKKDAASFSKYVLPELDCVITEEWDYTYIIWHKNNGAVEALSSYITHSKLRHFSNKMLA